MIIQSTLRVLLHGALFRSERIDMLCCRSGTTGCWKNAEKSKSGAQGRHWDAWLKIYSFASSGWYDVPALCCLPLCALVDHLPFAFLPSLQKRRAIQSDLQAAGLANHNEQMQMLVKQHTSEVAAVLEQRSQTHLNLKASWHLSAPYCCKLNTENYSCILVNVFLYPQAVHAQTQQHLQAKSDECLKLCKQLEGQTHVINTIEEELRAVRLEFAGIEKAVASNESRGKVGTAQKQVASRLRLSLSLRSAISCWSLAFLQWRVISQESRHLLSLKASY